MSKHRGAPAPDHDQHDQHDEQLMRPDGHRYEAPESDEERSSKSWAYAALALLVK